MLQCGNLHSKIIRKTNPTERPKFTNGSKQTNHDWPTPFESLANTIMAKLTNQCTQTGLSTFDWQQPFTWLWWWLPLRLSKRQSPLPTTVLLRTTLTRTIKLHYYMLPWVQTIYCKIIYSHNSKQRKPGYWLTSFNFEGSRYREIDIVNSYN